MRKIVSISYLFILKMFNLLYNYLGDFMLENIIKYIIFGLVQGFTEPLPISSSGHLVLLRYLFNTNAFDDLTFEIVLNFASFLAIFWIFRNDIFKLIKSFFTYIFKSDKRKDKVIKSDFKYAWLIVLGSIPAGLVGILFKDTIETLLADNTKVLGIAFLITAAMLFLVRKLNGNKKDEDITWVDAVVIGLFQMAALMPGISRSGAVLVGCLIVGLSRESSLKYAFMLYLPVSIGSFALSIKDLLEVDTSLLVPYALGFVASGIMTYFASLWFFDTVKKGRLAKFSIYLLILGITVLIFI